MAPRAPSRTVTRPSALPTTTPEVLAYGAMHSTGSFIHGSWTTCASRPSRNRYSWPVPVPTTGSAPTYATAVKTCFVPRLPNRSGRAARWVPACKERIVANRTPTTHSDASSGAHASASGRCSATRPLPTISPDCHS